MAPVTRSQNRDTVDKAWKDLTEALYQRWRERAGSIGPAPWEIDESVNRVLLNLYRTPHAFDRGWLSRYTGTWCHTDKTYQWAREFVDKASQESDHKRSFRYCLAPDNATQEVKLMRRMWNIDLPLQPIKPGIKRCNAMTREAIRKLFEDVDDTSDSMEVVTDEDDVNLDSDQDSEPMGEVRRKAWSCW